MDEREPPLIDLVPGEYRERQRGISVHTGQMLFVVAVAAAMLALTFVGRDGMSTAALFAVSAFFGLLGGSALTVLLRKWI